MKIKYLAMFIVLLIIIVVVITITIIERTTNQKIGFSFGEPKYSPGRDVNYIINTNYGKIYLIP